MRIKVKVTPKAKINKVMGFDAGYLKVKVTAAPDKGAANIAVIDLLSEYFDMPKRQIILVHGATTREKEFELEGRDSL